MSLFTIALKSIRQRLLASSLTALSVALGVALMIAVLLANNILQRTFNLQQFGYDLIVGPKGSQLELVLSTVYRIAPPIENLPWRYYEELKQNKQIATAVPVALGDRTEEGASRFWARLSNTLMFLTRENAAFAPAMPGRKANGSRWSVLR